MNLTSNITSVEPKRYVTPVPATELISLGFILHFDQAALSFVSYHHSPLPITSPHCVIASSHLCHLPLLLFVSFFPPRSITKFYLIHTRSSPTKPTYSLILSFLQHPSAFYHHRSGYHTRPIIGVNLFYLFTLTFSILSLYQASLVCTRTKIHTEVIRDSLLVKEA